MSLKDDVKAIKEELNTEEQFLESMIKSERFVKKYKKPLIAVVSLLVIGTLVYVISDNIKQSNLKASNEAYGKLLKNSDDKESLEILKSKNPKLYQAFMFHEAMKSSDATKLDELSGKIDDEILTDLIAYQKEALGKGDGEYSLRESAVMRDFALLEEAYKLFKDSKIKEAKGKLSQISVDSPVKKLSDSLDHFMGK